MEWVLYIQYVCGSTLRAKSHGVSGYRRRRNKVEFGATSRRRYRQYIHRGNTYFAVSISLYGTQLSPNVSLPPYTSGVLDVFARSVHIREDVYMLREHVVTDGDAKVNSG